MSFGLAIVVHAGLILALWIGASTESVGFSTDAGRTSPATGRAPATVVSAPSLQPVARLPDPALVNESNGLSASPARPSIDTAQAPSAAAEKSVAGATPAQLSRATAKEKTVKQKQHSSPVARKVVMAAKASSSRSDADRKKTPNATLVRGKEAKTLRAGERKNKQRDYAESKQLEKLREAELRRIMGARPMLDRRPT